MNPQKQKTNFHISRAYRLFLNLSSLILACKNHKWHLCHTQIKGITRVLTGK